MKPTTGLVLRLLGPLIQIACLIALFQTNAHAWSVAGVTGDVLLFLGFLVGFVLVIIGNIFVRRTVHTRPPDERR